MTKLVFWSSIALIAYSYFGYPALLGLLSFFRKKLVRRGPSLPRVTIIIAAYNEAQRIRAKVENTLSLEYPQDQEEIIVSSDGSTDETNNIVSTYKNRGVTLLVTSERHGKEYAQWQAIQASSGEVLIFSDVSTLLAKDALIQIVSNFNDSSIGCVSSEDKITTDPDTTAGEGMYVKYEMFLRRLESRVNSVVGLSGSFFAVRRMLCQDWSTTIPSDFLLVMRAAKQGYRAVSDPAAVGFYSTVQSEKEEFRRKVRTVMRGIAALMSHPDVLNPVRYGLFTLQVISHKLFRWLVPLFMLSAFISNFLLVLNIGIYPWLFGGQLVFYSLAILGLMIARLHTYALFKIPVFFTLVNLSIAVAWLRYLAGYRSIWWEPTPR